MIRRLIIISVVLASITLVNIMAVVHCQMSYAEAMNEMARCETEGGIACHIERDGLTYNVYSY